MTNQTGKEISRALNDLLKKSGGVVRENEGVYNRWIHMNFNVRRDSKRAAPRWAKGMVDHLLIDKHNDVMHFCEVKGDGDQYSVMQAAIHQAIFLVTEYTPHVRYWTITDAEDWADVINYVAG